MTKICSKCKKKKSLKEFSFKEKRKDRKQSYCKSCQREYSKQHYKNNKGYYKQRNLKKRKEINEWFKKYKDKLKCPCGENRNPCLDFHHPDGRRDKTIPEFVNNMCSIETIEKELETCEVLCANCHRWLHWGEKEGE